MRKNNKKVEHDYKVIDNAMLTNNSEYNDETPYNGPFLITQYWTSITATLQYGETKIRYNIRRIKPYTSDNTLNILTLRDMYGNVQYMTTSYILLYYIQSWKQGIK